jgi:uncharacterized protein (DUF302 family)
MMGKIFVKGRRSRYSFQETIEKIKKKAEELGWNIPAEHNMEEKLGRKVYIIELCKKEYAESVLSDERNYWVSAMMPCRIAVCEEQEGVKVYSMNMKLMTRFLFGDVKKVFKKVVEEEREILREVVKE